MTIEFAQINDLAPSNTEGTGVINYSVPGFGTPTGFKVIIGNADSITNPSSDIIFGYGFSDLTTDLAVSVSSISGLSTTNTNRHQSDAHCVYFGNTATILEAVFSATITDGVSINWSKVSTTVRRRISVILIKGTTNIKAVTKKLSSSLNYNINTIGFKSSYIEILTVGNTNAPPSTSTHYILGIGFAHNSSLDIVNQAYFGMSIPNSLAKTALSSTVRNDSIIGQLHNDSQSWIASVSAFNSSGFTLTANVNTGSDWIFILAIEDSSPDDISLDIIDSPIVTGDMTVTAPGFIPDFCSILQSMNSSVNTVDKTSNGGAFSIGSFDSTTEQNIGVSGRDSTSTSNNQSHANISNAIDVKKWGGSAFDDIYIGSFKTFDTNGYTLNITTEADSTARKWISVSFKNISIVSATLLQATTYQGMNRMNGGMRS